jgi:hypothetical protein
MHHNKKIDELNFFFMSAITCFVVPGISYSNELIKIKKFKKLLKLCTALSRLFTSKLQQ